MEYDRRLIGILEQQLLQHVEDDGEKDKGGKAGGDEYGEGRVGSEVAQWTGNVSEDTHIVQKRTKVLQRRCAVLLGGVAIDIFLWR
jgi:hypothetical protein